MNFVWKVLGVIGFLIVIAIARGIGRDVGRSSVESISSKGAGSTIEESLRQASSQLNGTLPMVIDKNTRLESTVPGPGMRWTYLYTLTSMSSAEVTQQELQTALGTSIKNGICTNKETAAFVDNGVQVVFRYRGNDGGVIGDIVVNPQDCR